MATISKNGIRILAGLVAVSSLIAIVILYWTRNQEIRFAEIFPDVFEYYVSEDSKQDGKIFKDSNEYNIVKIWFEKNSDGWRNDIKNYAPNRVLKSKALVINILNDGVVVNYTQDGKKWSQVSRRKAKNDLAF